MSVVHRRPPWCSGRCSQHSRERVWALTHQLLQAEGPRTQARGRIPRGMHVNQIGLPGPGSSGHTVACHPRQTPEVPSVPEPRLGALPAHPHLPSPLPGNIQFLAPLLVSSHSSQLDYCFVIFGIETKGVFLITIHVSLWPWTVGGGGCCSRGRSLKEQSKARHPGELVCEHMHGLPAWHCWLRSGARRSPTLFPLNLLARHLCPEAGGHFPHARWLILLGLGVHGPCARRSGPDSGAMF